MQSSIGLSRRSVEALVALVVLNAQQARGLSRDILKRLAKGPATVSQIAKALGLPKNNVRTGLLYTEGIEAVEIPKSAAARRKHLKNHPDYAESFRGGRFVWQIAPPPKEETT